jgi:hypothetical protein
MRRLLRTPLAALRVLAALASIWPGGCGQSRPGTSVEITLSYDAAIGLTTAEVTLGNRTESAPIAHELLLLVPDDAAGATMPIEVWGRKAGKQAAYGTTTVVPALGKTVRIALALDACAPACQGGVLTTCGDPRTCALGCADTGDAHCIAPRLSNGIDPALADQAHGLTEISANATFNTDTGEITSDVPGGLTRGAGTDLIEGIGYFQAAPINIGSGGAPLGIFVFHNLTIDALVTVRFTGAHAAVVLVGDTAQIAGTIDVTGGGTARSVPGPGGGVGGTDAGPARGCGPGAPGTHSGMNDGGGGGAGGATDGGPAGRNDQAMGGGVGRACLPMTLEPLQGGSGGGRGSAGGAASSAVGGGGGGALQISALGTLTVSGTINAGGAGGSGGPGSSSDAGAGGGGGSGGAILLEAPMVTITAAAILAANGGGGGGGGGGSLDGIAGNSGPASGVPAEGGGGVEPVSGGGAGGYRGGGPDVGGDGTTNGGGGGGAAGAIAIRGQARMVGGTVSPFAFQDDLLPPQ